MKTYKITEAFNGFMVEKHDTELGAGKTKGYSRYVVTSVYTLFASLIFDLMTSLSIKQLKKTYKELYKKEMDE